MEAFGQRPRMWTEGLLTGLVNIDEDTYGDWDASTLADELTAAGVVRTMRQVKIDGENRAGWLLRDVEGAIPAEVLAARPVAGVSPTPVALDDPPGPTSDGG
jgi:S-DNA-T family DNA segregation ATPase FtsK/SpoIIIE